MIDPRLPEALEICLAAMQTGAHPKSCLSLFPDLAEELEPLLFAARLAQAQSPALTPALAQAAQHSRAAFLQRASQMESSGGLADALAHIANRISSWLTRWTKLRLALAALSMLLVVILSLNGLAKASAKALPGDSLYPIKLAAETVSLQLAPNTELKHRIETDYNLRRAVEVKKLLALQRVERITFEGRVDQIGAERWMVEGIAVNLSVDTVLIGQMQPGDVIEVEGYTQLGGWVTADELHLRYFHLQDKVISTGSSAWNVGGLHLVITPETQIDPALQAGDLASVLVYSSDDGKLYARALLRQTPAPLPEVPPQPVEIGFSGQLESITGSRLVIGGKAVTTNAQTFFEGQLVTGAWVTVRALVNSDGSLTAISITALPQTPPAPSNPGIEAPPNDGGSQPEEGSGGQEVSGDQDDQEEDAGGEDDRDGDEDDGGDDDGDDGEDGEEDGDDEENGDDHEDGEEDDHDEDEDKKKDKGD